MVQSYHKFQKKQEEAKADAEIPDVRRGRMAQSVIENKTRVDQRISIGVDSRDQETAASRTNQNDRFQLQDDLEEQLKLERQKQIQSIQEISAGLNEMSRQQVEALYGQ